MSVTTQGRQPADLAMLDKVPPAAASAGSPPSTCPDAEPVLLAENLGKCFRLYAHPFHRAAEWLLGRTCHTPFWAVRGVSFRVRRGECLGIIGANGSGKSTLLKMLSGSLYPTEGQATVRGRVVSLIELGAGLNPQLTGRQNVLVMASLLNFPPDAARERLSEIEAFADIGEFFDRPVMLYSTGMRVRLAFSLFACMSPDVFLIDEALSVGDVFFQQKCAARLRQMLENGLTLVFVSHDLAAVQALCTRVILMERGRAVFEGVPAEAVSRYVSSLNLASGPRWSQPRTPAATPPATRESGSEDRAILAHDVLGPRRAHRHGTGHMTIVAARLTDDAGRDTHTVFTGEAMNVHVLLEAHRPIAQPRAGLRFHDRLGNLVFAAGTFQQGLHLPPLAPGQRLIVRFRVVMDVAPGPYTLGVGCGEPGTTGIDSGTAHDRIDLIGPVHVAQRRDRPREFFGVARLPMTITWAPLPLAASGERAP